jgi:hypothetical protein
MDLLKSLNVWHQWAHRFGSRAEEQSLSLPATFVVEKGTKRRRNNIVCDLKEFIVQKVDEIISETTGLKGEEEQKTNRVLNQEMYRR